MTKQNGLNLDFNILIHRLIVDLMRSKRNYRRIKKIHPGYFVLRDLRDRQDGHQRKEILGNR